MLRNLLWNPQTRHIVIVGKNLSGSRFPSEPPSHTIVRNTPMEAWAELIFRLVRFGYRNKVTRHGPGGTRTAEECIELQNVKVIVEKPEEEARLLT